MSQAAPVRPPGPGASEPWGGVPSQRDVWPTPAQELLLGATLLPDERALDAWRQVRAQVDVADLDGPSQALLPALRKNLLALGVEDELLGLFKGVHRYSWAKNQMLMAPMVPIVQALEDAGIPTLLLKGAAFVADARLDAGMRPMNDVDVLVPTARTGEAIDVLLASGLAPVGGVPAWYVADYAPRFVPSHGFRDQADRQLDLHWHVLHASCQADADEDFWAASEPIELLGVRTRALCAADELLLVVLHGLRWNANPTYRWVLDAALLCRGSIGEVDYERLAEQARKRRVTVALRAGLSYLRRVVDAPVPQSCIRDLSRRWPLALERLELRAQMTQPKLRSKAQWQVLYHQQSVRRDLPLAQRPTLAKHVALARQRLGIERPWDLRNVFSGGRPGPGRPACEVAAAVGAGVEGVSTVPIEPGRPIKLGEGDTARAYTAYGTWLAERGGCWIAGRQARLVLPLDRPVDSLLALEILADGFLTDARPRQRLEVLVGGTRVGSASVERDRGPLREVMVLPERLFAGRSQLDLLLRAPDAATPAELGLEDDDRRVGVFLRELVVREPRLCEIGATVTLGEGADDESMLADGWGAAEPLGRWTLGGLAQLLMRVPAPTAQFELEFDAIPFVGSPKRTLRTEVLVNGRRVASFAYDQANSGPSAVRVPLAHEAVERHGGMLLGWRIVNPRSPRSLGVSEDARELGLFVRRVSLIARS